MKSEIPYRMGGMGAGVMGHGTGHRGQGDLVVPQRHVLACSLQGFVKNGDQLIIFL